MRRDKIAFIVEGVKTEPMIVNNIRKNFFDGEKVQLLVLPSGINIYMLWKKIQEDEGDTNIIDLLKEDAERLRSRYVRRVNEQCDDFDYFVNLNASDFSEIYLFFDYDGHVNNLPDGILTDDIIKSMLETFDNETEFGKLYISYPMVEAIRHFSSPSSLCNNEDCFIKMKDACHYKELIHISSCIGSLNLENIEIDYWKDFLKRFLTKVSCLLEYDQQLDVDRYKAEDVTTLKIFEKQKCKYLDSENKVMTLSAFPEFILDYFTYEYLYTRFNFNFINDCYVDNRKKCFG